MIFLFALARILTDHSLLDKKSNKGGDRAFAGSVVVGEASLNLNRNCILIEILSENINKIRNRFLVNYLFMKNQKLLNMNEYIFYTTEGCTQASNSINVENLQIFVFTKANNENNAFMSLLKDNLMDKKE